MWKKLGRIFAGTDLPWMTSHAQNPLPEAMGGGRFRVHFAARDAQNRSRGGAFEFDPRRPFDILAVSDAPSIDLGELGAFDDCGVMPSSIVTRGETQFLYYTGWSRAVEVPFSFHVGLATSRDGGRTFLRRSRAPVLGRNEHDPFITGAPFVVVEGDRWRMWYVSATRWERQPNGVPRHFYTIKHADSQDGIHWNTSDHLCLPFASGEYALARPVVFIQDGRYQMWFSWRAEGTTYRVGTAVSDDGLTWERRGTPEGLDVSPSGWDAEMLCYAHPFTCDGVRYVLYNGNDYGRSGIGIAVWEPRR